MIPSKELLSEVLGRDVDKVKGIEANTFIYGCVHSDGWYDEINIYELVHLNLKQWAKLKNVFDIIDWSEEPEKIFAKAEELRNEIS